MFISGDQCQVMFCNLSFHKEIYMLFYVLIGWLLIGRLNNYLWSCLILTSSVSSAMFRQFSEIMYIDSVLAELW